MKKTAKRNTWKAALVQKTAELTGVSKRQVRRVLAGDCENETIMKTYMALYEGENLLLKSVKELLPSF